MKTFSEVINYLSGIPNLNQGGCVVASVAMHRWLKKQNVDSEIVFLYNEMEDDTFERNNQILCDTKIKAKFTGCTHSMLFYDGNYYDSDGLNTDSAWFPYEHFVPENYAIEALNHSTLWNPMFERSHIKDIELKLGVNLSDIKISIDYKINKNVLLLKKYGFIL